jgi:hypothetical protein
MIGTVMVRTIGINSINTLKGLGPFFDFKAYSQFFNNVKVIILTETEKGDMYET